MRKKLDPTGLAETLQHKANIRITLSLLELPPGKISATGSALIEALKEAGYIESSETQLPSDTSNQKMNGAAAVGTAVKEPRMPDAMVLANVKKHFDIWNAEMLTENRRAT